MPGFSRHYFGSASISRGVPRHFLAARKVRLILRDGPLEKLLRWGGGGEEFSSCTNFFVNISFVGIFFFRMQELFSGLLVVYEFFHSIFSYMNVFVLCSPPPPPPPPHNFSNGPSLSRRETNIVTDYDYSQKKHLLFQSYCRSRIIT